MGKFLLSWDLLKWISHSKEGIYHGMLYFFPQPLPQPIPQLSMKQCLFTSHGNNQDNSQVQELLPCSWLPSELTESSCPTEKGLASRAGPHLTESLYGLTQATKSDFANWGPLVLWQQVEADESYPSVRTSILLSESWAFFPAQTSDLSAAKSHAAEK